MRPFDPRLLRRARGAAPALAADVLLGVLSAVALLLHAVVFAGVVAAAFDGRSPSPGTVAVLAGIAVVRAGAAGGFEFVGRRAAARLTSELRMTLVERRLEEAPLDADGVQAAEVATAAVHGVDALEVYFARYLPQVVLAVLVPAMVLIWTATVDPTSAAIMAITLPMIPIFMVLIGRATAARTRARWQALARLSSHFLDVVRGLTTLRAFNRAEVQADRIGATGEEYRAATMQVLRMSFLSGAVLDLIATIATALVAVTLGVRLIGGGVGLLAALTVLILTPELYAPLRAVAAQFHASADGLAAAERILDLIDGSPRASNHGSEVPPTWEVVRLESVEFANPDRAGRVLDGFDLELRRGEIVALVGASGAGKSTVANLLLGLRRPDVGMVTVGGVDLASLDLRSWRQQVAWLPQRATLFRGSVVRNIAMGDPQAAPATIRSASRTACADVFVDDLRHGAETVVGDGGRALSAGEARRIALARALVRDAPLLILDEPTANLDARTSTQVLAAIADAARDRAVLLIEHDRRHLGIADRIVRIQDGRAVELESALR